KGGGKSFICRWKATFLCLKYPGIRILVLRKTFPELRQNHQLPLQKDLNGVATFKESEKVFIFPNGSRIQLGFCDTDSDVFQYIGVEYDVMFIDEASLMTEYQLEMLKSCVRGVNAFPKRTYYATNPGGPGHAYLKRLFIDRVYKEKENPDNYVFIPARVYDNTALMEAQPDYVDQLESLPEDLRRAYLDGDWNIFAGQYFTEWDTSLHIIEPFVMPPSWRHYLSLDYGLDMLACYWIAVDEYGKAYVYRELYQSGLIVSEAAAKIMQINKEMNENIFAAYAPPDLWNRRNDTGKSAAEIFAESGLYLARATNNRVQGWYNLKEWLHPAIGEQGQRTCALKIFKNCVNLIRCLPLLQFDEKDPNDTKREPHEITHAPDAIRYFVAGRPMPAQKPIYGEPSSYNYEDEVKNFLDYGRS
ncbi:MAG TPA: hypothetical protein PLD93_01320, partial [Synergistaceae bacterium]|nr:hypothetical protein [Synergistaceae bacterium]